MGGDFVFMEEKLINQTEVAEGDQVEQPPDEHPMNALMEDALTFRRLRTGDIVDGEIVSVTPTEVLVDVGAKSEGLAPSKELERLGREGLETLQVGHVIPVYVVRTEDRDGNLILSIRRAEEESDWRRAQELHEKGEPFETQVAGFNKISTLRLSKSTASASASSCLSERLRACGGTHKRRNCSKLCALVRSAGEPSAAWPTLAHL